MPALQTKALLPALYRFAQSPSAIAAIASLCTHALLFALLPLLPSAVLSDKEPEIKRSVGMVALTPTEQSRLPEISNSVIELPSIVRQPLPSNPSDIYSLNPLPPDPSGLPPYSGYSSAASDPILDILRQYSDASQPDPVAPNPPAPNPPAPNPPAPPRQTIPPAQPVETPAQGASGVQPTPQPTTTPTPSITPTLSITPTPFNSSQPPSNDSSNNNSSPSQSEASTNQPSPRSLDEIRLAQVDRIRQRREQLAQLAPDDTGIGNGAVAASMGTWSEAAGAWLDGDKQKFDQIFKDQVQFVGAYPVAACPLQVKRLVLVGVFVGADGKVVNEPGNRPQILQGSGYKILNRKAIEDAIAQTFEPTGEKKAYILQISYEYTPEVCPEQSSPQPQNPQG